MKTTFLLIIALLVGQETGWAQTVNNLPITYSQEDSAVTRSELQRVYRYITRANVEEKTLIKLGFWPNAIDREFSGRPTFRIGLNADASVERKLSPSLSLLVGFDLAVRYNRINQLNFTAMSGYSYTDVDRSFLSSVYGKIGVRYYYGMAKRIREGKSANNFSGNYVGLQVARALSVYNARHLYDTRTGEPVRTEKYDMAGSYNAPLIAAMWGIQRRVGRRGFFDINAGPEITVPRRPEDPYGNSLPNSYFYKNSDRPGFALRVNAVIGLGW
ncbi:hypothetical protein GCM10027347_04160 [Larkinella harenae]